MNIKNNEEKKDSVLFNILKYVLATLFPFVRMMRLNSQLITAEKTIGSEAKDRAGNYISPYGWFKRQRTRNLIFGFAGTIPFLFSMILSYNILTTNEIFMKGLNASKRELVKFRPLEAKKKFEIANQYDPSVGKDMKIAFYTILFGITASFSIGIIIVYFHPVIVETAKLKKYLTQAGYIKAEENPEVLATPIGFLIDIAGNTPREIADSDRIWIPLNIRVNKDWAENPTKRSLVFFKRAYELKRGEEYGFTKIPN